MRTHTLFFVSIAVMIAVFFASLINKPAKAEITSVALTEAEAGLMIEDWMHDEQLWGINNKAIEVEAEPERSLEIENWMYDAEYWGLN